MTERGRRKVAEASPMANRDFLGVTILGKMAWSCGGGSKFPTAPVILKRLGIGVVVVLRP